MKIKNIIGLVVVLVMVLTASIVFAQPMKSKMGWRGSGGWGMGTQYHKMFNSATIETISGDVENVDKITPTRTNQLLLQ